MPSTDRRAQHTEDIVGANHPTLADTANRLSLADHQNSGAHHLITEDDWVNTDGGSVTAGMVVVQNTASARAFARTAVAAMIRKVMVVAEVITASDTGRVGVRGCGLVNVQGNVAIGDLLRTSVTLGRAEKAVGSAGAFAVARTAYAGGAAGQVEADLFGVTMPAGASFVGMSRVVGAVGAWATTTTYTMTSAMAIEFYNPTTGVIEKLVTAQGGLTCSTATQGRNGRDQAGALAAGWVYLYYTWDGSTVALRVSQSAPPTGPTLANGETSWAFICVVSWGGSAFSYVSILRGDRVSFPYIQFLSIASPYGGAGVFSVGLPIPPQGIAPTWSGKATLGYAPQAGVTAVHQAAIYDVSSNNLWMENLTTQHFGYTVSVWEQIEWSIPDLPNTNQAVYYHFDQTNTYAPAAASLFMNSYTVANGG